MNHERILEYIAGKLLTLNLTGITADDVHLPNLLFRRENRDLWFELSIGEGEPINHADTADRRLITVNVICAVQTGSGTKRLNNVAEKVAKMFSPLISKRSGFTIGTDVFTVRRVMKFPAEQTGEGLKINVRFTLDKYSQEV